MGFELSAKTASMRTEEKPDPLANVEYTGDPEIDAKAEAAALYTELKAARKQQRDRVLAIGDSEYWLALCFTDRASKEAVLRAVGGTKLGDKYVDGHALARLMGIDLSAQ